MRSRSSASSGLAFRSGARRLSSGSSSVALRRSLSTASATPGYCTLTTTASPSSVVARCTWPIDAAASARSSKSEKTPLSGPPSSERISFSSLANGTGGMSSRSVASLASSSVRCSSGNPSNSIIDSSCPTFIAAPRIRPSWSTSSPTSLAVRSSWAAAARSGERTRLAVRIPAQRSPWPVDQPADPCRPGDPPGRQPPRLKLVVAHTPIVRFAT